MSTSTSSSSCLRAERYAWEGGEVAGLGWARGDNGATWRISPNLMGRYFLVEVEKDYSILNPNSCVNPPDIMPSTLFAPAGSFILAFSGTVGSEPQFAQDGILGFPKACYLLDDYQTYDKMLEVSVRASHTRAALPTRAEQSRSPHPRRRTRRCSTESTRRCATIP